MSASASEEEPYRIPARIHRAEHTVRRSRFIATLGPAPDVEAAHRFIHSIEDERPDATHHCWAFVAGPPGTTAHIGLSDAGEPHGTAGRPILTALLHSGVGEVAAVVTRYFGGVKLGKGGLSRAYAEAVTVALAELPTTQRVTLVSVRIRVPFAASDALFRLLEDLGACERQEGYGEGLEIRARVPERALERLERDVAALTSGAGRVDVLQ